MTSKTQDLDTVLEPVKDINVDALAAAEPLALENKLNELNSIKSKYPDGSPDRIKIEGQILAINSKIAEIEAERKKNSNKKNEAAKDSAGERGNKDYSSKGSDSNINTANFSDLSKNREEILNIIADGIKNNSITNEATGPRVSSIGEQILSFSDGNAFDSLKKAISGIYDNLKKMGLDVREAENKTENKEESVIFYAIRFPQEYLGERDAMKINKEEVDAIKNLYKKESSEEKKSIDSHNYEISALGHANLINNELMLRSFGLRKVEEKFAKQEAEIKPKSVLLEPITSSGLEENTSLYFASNR
jgi:predicted transcriptional regulator